MKHEVDKEYFAYRAIQLISGVKYYYKLYINGIIETLKQEYGLYVPDMSDDELHEYIEKELSEYQKYILSQMVNSDTKTIEEIGLLYQKQLSEIYQQQNFFT